MEMNIEYIPQKSIAYMRHTGPYGEGNKSTMELLKAWAKEALPQSDDAVILGIAQDNPEVTAPENCRYDACLIVADDFCTHDSRVCLGKLAGGCYAVFLVTHTADAIQEAWRGIFPELLKRGCVADMQRPIIERYAVKMVNNHKCEICVPLSTPV